MMDSSSDDVSAESGAQAENETRSNNLADQQADSEQDSKPELIIPASPPKFVSMQQLTEAANAFCQMSLAHEITVDADFKLEKYEHPDQSLAGVIKETMHRAFWDVLRSSLDADPPDYEPAIRLLAEVRESLMGLVLPNQASLQQRIETALDIDAVHEHLNAGGRLDMAVYIGRVVDLMKQFCAPLRDEAVDALQSYTDPVEAFKNAFLLLETMHMDLANFTIAKMRPFIRQQAVAYERTKFADFLEAQQKAGLDGLVCTRHWLRQAHGKLVGMSQADPPATANVSLTAVTPNNLLREAYLLLLTQWQQPAKDLPDWPETMLMDQLRLLDLAVQLSNIVVLTSLVLVACNRVAADVELLFPGATRSLIQSHPEATTVLKRAICHEALLILESSHSNQLSRLPASVVADQLLLTMERWYAALTSSVVSPTSLANDDDDNLPSHRLPERFSQELRSQAVDVVKQQSPVYRLMYERAVNFLRAALSSQPPEPLPLPPGFSVLNDAKARMVAPQSMTAGRSTTGGAGPSSSSSVQPPAPHQSLNLTDLAGRLLPLLTHNRHVFGPHYTEIVRNILSVVPEGEVNSVGES